MLKWPLKQKAWVAQTMEYISMCAVLLLRETTELRTLSIPLCSTVFYLIIMLQSPLQSLHNITDISLDRDIVNPGSEVSVEVFVVV